MYSRTCAVQHRVIMPKRSARTTKNVNYAECSDSDSDTAHTSSHTSATAPDSDIEIIPSKPVKRSKVAAKSRKSLAALRGKIDTLVADTVQRLVDSASSVLRQAFERKLLDICRLCEWRAAHKDDWWSGITRPVTEHVEEYLANDAKYTTEITQLEKLITQRNQLSAAVLSSKQYLRTPKSFADAHLIPVCHYLDFDDMIALRQVNKQRRTVCQQRDAWKYITFDVRKKMFALMPKYTRTKDRVHHFANLCKVVPKHSLQQLQTVKLDATSTNNSIEYPYCNIHTSTVQVAVQCILAAAPNVTTLQIETYSNYARSE